MWFNSFSFLWFFPTVLIVYYAIPSWRGRKIALLIASYFFYACWNPPFLLLLVASSLVDYTLGLALGRIDDARKRKLLVAASCVMNFGVLASLKYAGFFLGPFYSVLPDWISKIVLPVGI